MWNRRGTLLVNNLPTITHVTSLAPCQCVLAASSAGVNGHRFPDDQSILHQFSNLLACGTDTVYITDADTWDTDHTNIERTLQ